MKKKSSEKTKPKAGRTGFNLWALRTERVSLAGDLKGCVLVIPEVLRSHEHMTLYQGRLPEYHL
jgi:hypothetical protein